MTSPAPATAASSRLADAGKILAAARIAVQNPDAGLDDAWPRAAALLARQALELAIEARLVDRIPDLDGVSMRDRLACLSELTVPAAAHEAAWLWARLSGACHHHPHDLTPTGAELSEWIGRTAALVAASSGASSEKPEVAFEMPADRLVRLKLGREETLQRL